MEEDAKQALREEIYQEVRDTIAQEVKAQERAKWTDSGYTSVIYLIGPDAKEIIPRFIINQETVKSLVDSDYIPQEMSEDEDAIKLALILLTNEVSEQILETVIEEANDVLN